MPLGHTACRPLPELELLKRKPISAQKAADKLRLFLGEQKQVAPAELATAGPAQVTYNQLSDVLLRLENDWVGHPEERHLDCFVEVDAHVEVHMMPMFMGKRLKEGLRKAAGDILLKYQRALGCIPLTTAELAPAGSRHAAIVGDGPFVHFLASFKCVGFAPQKDHWLLGRVSENQPWYKGMNISVLSLVNIMVQQDSLPRELHYSREQRVWLNSDKDDKVLGEKHLVLLKIVRVDTEVSRQGDMGMQLTGHVESTGHIREKRRTPKAAASPGPSAVETPQPKRPLADTPPPSSKRKRDKDVPGGDAGNGVASNGTVNGEEDRSKKKKKDKDK
jgi:DNA-directed RNA polymerase subunit E'/Rpb7